MRSWTITACGVLGVAVVAVGACSSLPCVTSAQCTDTETCSGGTCEPAYVQGNTGGPSSSSSSGCIPSDEVHNLADNGTLDLFGAVVFFNGGAALPAGAYQVTYVDGCMKYNAAQGWTVNAIATGESAWWLVGSGSADQKAIMPGHVGHILGAGGFAVFSDCVTASLASAPMTYVHAGGPLGIWLKDSPSSDNVAGENGRNPRWRLSSCGH